MHATKVFVEVAGWIPVWSIIRKEILGQGRLDPQQEFVHRRTRHERMDL
jgi:hypothetical protein